MVIEDLVYNVIGVNFIADGYNGFIKLVNKLFKICSVFSLREDGFKGAERRNRLPTEDEASSKESEKARNYGGVVDVESWRLKSMEFNVRTWLRSDRLTLCELRFWQEEIWCYVC
jgi:hypothetical protein